jgi:outer membrane protein
MGLRAFASVVVCSLIAAPAARAEKIRKLSLADAIAIAMQHNGDLYLAQADTEVAGEDVAFADAVFIPRLVVETRAWSQRNTPTAISPFYTEEGLTGSVGIAGRRASGLSYSLAINSSVQKISLGDFNPAFTSSVAASVTQPLLRGAGSANRTAIVVAAHRREVSEHQLRVQVQRIVGDVVVAYWTLVLAYKEVDARASQFKLAQDQQAESQRLVRLGSLSDLDVVEARAGVAKQKQQLLRAEQGVVDAEARLRAVLVGNDATWAAGETIVPTDNPDASQEVGTVEHHVELARKNRPDISVARAQIKSDEAALVETANGLKPALDLIANAALFGFAGTPTPLLDDPQPEFDGSFARALTNLGKRGDYVVSVALRLELPLSNQAARARHARQRVLVARAKVTEETISAQIRNDVQTALALLQSDAALRNAADDAVTDNQKLLVGMRKRFAGGLITSFDVLRVADELSRAQIEAARTRVSYQISRARLGTADGTLLESLGVKLTTLRKR